MVSHVIRSAFFATCLVASTASAQERDVDTTIDAWRTPVEALSERMIGSASKSVRFDWRRSPASFALIGSELLERNNFGSTRVGVLARKAVGDFMGEVAVSRVFTWGTDSSQKLSLTPYRQFGRPNRFELDVNIGYALVEGVVTLPSLLPPAQMVLSANVGLRYLSYPEAFADVALLDIAQALVSPQLSAGEINNLERTRLPGMQVDPARYGLLAGLGLDVYIQPGAFVTPRAMLAIPLLSPVNGTGLGWWWELTLGLGWAL